MHWFSHRRSPRFPHFGCGA